MAGPGHQLNFSQVVSFAFLVIASVFFDQFKYFLFVSFADELPNDFFGYIATDVFIVVAFTLDFLLFDSLE